LRNTILYTCLLVGGAVVAQPAPTPTPDTPPDDTTAPATDGTDATLGGSISANLSLAEMTEQVAQLDTQTEEDAQYVLRLQLQARKEKDVIKLNCINDKLLQIKALRNIIEGAKSDFDIAVSGANSDEQHYQFSRVTLSADNIRALREEANACAGEIPDLGETKSTWEGPDLPDDPTDPFETGIEPPGYASPFS
jgi:hypothetical protein